MSDESSGAGWWLATDGKWYPPGANPPPPRPTETGSTDTPARTGRAVGDQPPLQGSQTNGLAIASMVLGILWIYWLGSILALVLGYVARRQIDRSGGREQGRGMATAGIVLGWVGAAVLAVFVGVIVLGRDNSTETGTGVIPGQIGATTSTSPAGGGPSGAQVFFRPVLALVPVSAGAEDLCNSFGPVDPPPSDVGAAFSSDQGECYQVGPAVLVAHVESAVRKEADNGYWSVVVTFTDTSIERIDSAAEDCYGQTGVCPTGQLAVVVNGEVLTAPTIDGRITGSNLVLGGLDEAQARQVAAALSGR